jgi:hypothetical protein
MANYFPVALMGTARS